MKPFDKISSRTPTQLMLEIVSAYVPKQNPFLEYPFQSCYFTCQSGFRLLMSAVIFTLFWLVYANLISL